MNDIVGLKPVDGFYSKYLTADVDASLYHLPTTPLPATFWRIDRQILTGILMYKKLYEQNEPPSRGPESIIPKHIPIELANIFGLETFDTPIKDSDEFNWRYSDVIQDLYTKKMPILMRLISEKFAASYMEALRESIHDYVSESSVRKYMIVLHKTMDPNTVFMTMSIRLYKDMHGKLQFEHRHISKSIRAIVGPILSDSISPAPGRLSMLMHTTSLRFMKTLHPNVSQLYINPLTSMYNILVKSGFAPPLTQEQQRFGAHNLVISGDTYRRLLNYFETARKLVNPGVKLGMCVQCKHETAYKCGTCDQPIICKNADQCYTYNKDIDHECVQ